jgi:hypothetical protein
MSDDRNEKLEQLLTAARAVRPDTARVELGFETRLLARLRAMRAAEPPWFAYAWKLAPFFASIVLALGVWTFVTRPADPPDWQSALSAELDMALWEFYFEEP